MSTTDHTCAGCKQPIDICPYGGDCLEMQAIYREQQREQIQDIDLDELCDCMECGAAIDSTYVLCYRCEQEINAELLS